MKATIYFDDDMLPMVIDDADVEAIKAGFREPSGSAYDDGFVVADNVIISRQHVRIVKFGE